MAELVHTLVSVVALVGIIFATSVNGAKTSRSYNGGNYTVAFEAVGTNITFDVVVRGVGWVGLGVSRNPNMTNADLCISGVFNQTTSYMGDYYSTTNGAPIRDTKPASDWELTSFNETTTTTTLTIKRLLNTSDTSGQDIEIKNENIYLIWAIGPDDDVSQKHTFMGPDLINLVGSGASSVAATFALIILQSIHLRFLA